MGFFNGFDIIEEGLIGKTRALQHAAGEDLKDLVTYPISKTKRELKHLKTETAQFHAEYFKRFMKCKKYITNFEMETNKIYYNDLLKGFKIFTGDMKSFIESRVYEYVNFLISISDGSRLSVSDRKKLQEILDDMDSALNNPKSILHKKNWITRDEFIVEKKEKLNTTAQDIEKECLPFIKKWDIDIISGVENYINKLNDSYTKIVTKCDTKNANMSDGDDKKQVMLYSSRLKKMIKMCYDYMIHFYKTWDSCMRFAINLDKETIKKGVAIGEKNKGGNLF